MCLLLLMILIKRQIKRQITARLNAKLLLTASRDMSRPINILRTDFERKNMEVASAPFLSLFPNLPLPFFSVFIFVFIFTQLEVGSYSQLVQYRLINHSSKVIYWADILVLLAKVGRSCIFALARVGRTWFRVRDGDKSKIASLLSTIQRTRFGRLLIDRIIVFPT